MDTFIIDSWNTSTPSGSFKSGLDDYMLKLDELVTPTINYELNNT
jgi:hypothetical protein